MKKLFLTLVFMIVSLCALAQTDYVAQAQVNIKKYYPQYEEYFKPIFAATDNLSLSGWNKIINDKIHENFAIFDDELTTERDRCTTILTVLDDLLGDSTFINSKKMIDSSDGEGLIIAIASEISSDIKVQCSRELRSSREELASSREELASSREELAKEREKLSKINEVSDKIKAIKEKVENNNNTKEILQAVEELFEVSEVSGVKDSPGTQEIIKYYISLSNKINHTPSANAQKFINEYNRIIKQ